MALSNTQTRYGAVTKTFHWLTALLILTLIPLGFYANALPYDTSEELARKAYVFSIHKTLGVFTFFVALARILWAVSQPKPGLLHADRKLESFAAETAHWLLYGSLVIVPLSGWIHHASTTGFAPIWWPLGQDLPLVPKSDAVASVTAGVHRVFALVLAGSIAAHVAGALKHHLIDRDATLLRMLPGRPAVPDVSGAHRFALPVVGALAIWGGALAGGATFGAFESHSISVQAAALEDVQSDWAVQEGEIAITVTQLGSEVTGQFSDWTASISFDESVTEGVAGTVDVTISIGSLTLGSVTGQAMGEDFFNAEDYPTANFSGDLIAGADGYRAEGTLTIKEQSAPVSFPFDLEVTDGVAAVSANTTLDRRNYEVGTTSQPDESNLAFDVGVRITLTAQEDGTAPEAGS
jgi:cytochrome b561/polyisoprenoid-binding protein YceI